MNGISYEHDLAHAGVAWRAGLAAPLSLASRTPARLLLVTGIGASEGVACCLAGFLRAQGWNRCRFIPADELLQQPTPSSSLLLISAGASHLDTTQLLQTAGNQPVTVISCRSQADFERALGRPLPPNWRWIAAAEPSSATAAFVPAAKAVSCLAAGLSAFGGKAIAAKAADLWSDATAALQATSIGSRCERLHILAFPGGRAAAYDLQNRLLELGGLISILHEPLGFAHGQYRALEGSPARTTKLVAFIAASDQLSWTWLRSSLPQTIQTFAIQTSHQGWMAEVTLLLSSIQAPALLLGAK